MLSAATPTHQTARSTASAPIAASVARSPTRSRMTRSSRSMVATARLIRIGSASRVASASTMSIIVTGAVTAPFMAAEDSDVIIVIGANPTENHPVAATFFKNAAKRGAALIVMDPRGQALKRHATHMLQFKPGRDVAMLNALLHVIIEEGLHDKQYVQAHTDDFEKLKEHVKAYAPEAMAPICGIDAETLRLVARKYARAEA